MSKIDKLSILGIRSFDNARSETIQFYSPLTLIVGYNGSGKTTIIECLKYATTGELPPNSTRGGAFIHDPKLCGEREVLAQVRLAFLSTTQARMVATRNIQLQVKKTTRTQKTLEGQLLMVKDGERTSVSTRVAELDQMLPQFLGVSKAVLESVIFCHQEDSLWPMSEPGVLKKKFDEIFEALKYTKAIDNIKQLRKKQNEELGKFKLVEQHSKENKDRADKAVRKLGELQEEIEILRKEQQELQDEASAVGDKAQNAWNNVARFTEVVESLRMARHNSEFYSEQVQDLEKDLQVLPDSDEWLTSELGQFEDRVRVQEKRRAEQTKRYERVQQEIKQTRDQHGSKRMEAGRHEQAKLTHEARIKDRDAAIRKAANDRSIRGYDMDLDDVQINEFMERISKLSTEQNARVDRLRRENAGELQKIQEVLDELRERRTTLTENRKSARERIDASDRRIKSAHAEMQKLSIDEAGRANLNANIDELVPKLEKAKGALKAHEADGKIRNGNKILQELEENLALLNKKLIETSKQAAERGRFEHLQKEAKERQRSLETMKGAHGARIGVFLGTEWNEASLEKAYETLMDSKKEAVTKAERQRDSIDRELEQIEYKLKTARAELKKKRGEADAGADQVRQVIQDEPSEYPAVLEDAERNRDQRKSDVEGFIHMQDYFTKAIEVAESDHPACRLCQRAFSDAEAARQFAGRLLKQSSLKQLDECRQELKQWEDELQRFKDVSASHDTWKRLTEKEIPAGKTDISANELLRKSILDRLEAQDLVVRNLEDERRDADGLSKPVSTITKCRAELNDFQGQIQQLSEKHGADQSFPSLEDLQDQMACAEAEVKDQRQKVARLQADEQGHRSQISTLEMELSSARSKLVTADHELEKKAGMASQIGELKSSNQDQNDVIATIDLELQQLGPRWSEETARRDDYKQRAEARESEVQRVATDLMDTSRELQRIHAEAQRYVEEGGQAQLAKTQSDILTLEQQLASLDTEVKQVTVEINRIQEELGSQDKKKRTISDNLRHREARRKLTEVQDEIDRLSAQNAEADQQQHRKDAEHFQKEHQQVLAQATSKVERMKVKDDQLQQLIKDWETDYKDAAPNYKRAHIQVETTKAAVEDLGRYGAALDKAIMKYHTAKMEEINRIVEELWRRTYQGTDVDSILIRSDNETQKGNRSYNYRVCMVKQDVEMDMRGRCSAGQKVLASIIIRLALAECFGVNCGLIALDEPTTNLDRDNIRSLAEALNHIIRQRRQQKNFQLIVITHDEDFLRAIKPQEFCDHYYRVSRNDRQKSIIERQNIAAVM